MDSATSDKVIEGHNGRQMRHVATCVFVLSKMFESYRYWGVRLVMGIGILLLIDSLVLAQTTTFMDNFNRANSTSLGANWVERSGDFEISNNQLKLVARGSMGLARITPIIPSADYSVEAKLVNATAPLEWFGVFGRGANFGTGDASFYTALLNGSKVYLYKRVSGSWGGLGSAAVTVTNGDRIKLDMRGTTIKVFYNDVEKISAVDSGLTSSGYAGVDIGSGPTSTGHLWDDFVVSAGAVSVFPNLTVTKSGTGAGTITSIPSGINCGVACSASFASGTSTSLIATANSGSSFSGWSGACTGTASCAVIMDANKSVTATFSASNSGSSFTDNFNRSGSTSLGSNWVERSGDFEISNNQLKLVARGSMGLARITPIIPSADYSVEAKLVNATAPLKWFGIFGRGVDFGAGDASFYTALLNGSKVYLYKRVSGSWGGLGSSAVTVTNGDRIKLDMRGTTIKVFYNDVEKISAVDSGLTSSGYAGVDIGIGPTSTGHLWDDFVVSAGAVSVFPNLTVTKSGAGFGTITSIPSGINCGVTCSASFASGTSTSLIATANSGSSFSGWSGDSDCTDGSLTMNANKACTATFTLTPVVTQALPVILFTDIEYGPVTSGPNNLGVPISLFGKGFGSTRGNSKVTIGGVEVGSYMVWGEKNAHNTTLDMIVVQPGANVLSGPIQVSVNGINSNTDFQFTTNTGKIYYISTTGSDSATCAETAQCATISHVVANVMKPGDTVLVRGGMYQEGEIYLRSTMGGTTSAPKTIKRYPGEEATLANGARPFIIDTDYITVSGFNFQNGKSTGAAGWSNRHQSGVKIIDSTFIGKIGYDAISSHGDNHIFAGNVCKVEGSNVGTQGHCYYISDGQNIKLIYNIGSGVPGYPIHIYDQRRSDSGDFQRIIKNVLIEGNILFGSSERSGMLISMDDEANLGNYISDITIRNNVFTGSNHHGLVIGKRITNLKIYNNTFYENGLQGLYVGGQSGNEVSKNLDISKNIFYQSLNNSVCKIFCTWYTPAHMAIGDRVDNVTVGNNYYGPGGPVVVNTQSAGSPIPNPDTAPITGSITFVDPPRFDFRVNESIVSGIGAY